MTIRPLAVVSIAVLSSIASSGCGKKPVDEPFSCQRIQTRAEACEQNALTVVRQGILASAKDGAADADAQYNMFEVRFKQKLQQKQTQKLCEKYQDGDASHTRRLDSMKTCYRATDCDAFAKCMLEM